ncbi:MAG: glutathione peroxidase [Gammaproteobacteria bacterium]|nr:glutathione peroxidase [Gammaproteobacteria bacterium]MDG2297918.1 glutathione peroxidase [Gammaproteobacteria bacterium]
MSNIYDFDCKNAQGDTVSLSDYKNKVLLIVNTASKCGFTPQYEGLNNLHLKYSDEDFSVLGFPCNQFGKQEPGTNQEIQEFCSINFQIKFPVFGKIDVKGPSADPLYQHLTEEKPGLLGSKNIKWNFTKFLVDQNGNVIARFAPKTKPEDIEKEINALLK